MEPETDGARGLADRIDELVYRWDELRRRPVTVIAVGSLLVVAIAVAWIARAGGGAEPPVEDRIPQLALEPSVTPPTSEAEAAEVVVHVAGMVYRPGVYPLPAGSRVLDAIDAAGGATPEGRPDRLNLAAPVVDGSRIRVPTEDEEITVPAEPGDGASPTAEFPLDLNRATTDQLDALPGVGPAIAAAIVSHRDEIGGFERVEDLLDVSGIGEAKLSVISELVVVR